MIVPHKNFCPAGEGVAFTRTSTRARMRRERALARARRMRSPTIPTTKTPELFERLLPRPKITVAPTAQTKNGIQYHGNGEQHVLGGRNQR